MAFQPGQSGNPGGRSKREKFITQQLIAELNEIDPQTEAKRLRKVVKALISKAEEGDVTAAREIFDRVEGKVPTVLAGDEDNPIRYEKIERLIVHPSDTDSRRLPTAH